MKEDMTRGFDVYNYHPVESIYTDILDNYSLEEKKELTKGVKRFVCGEKKKFDSENPEKARKENVAIAREIFSNYIDKDEIKMYENGKSAINTKWLKDHKLLQLSNNIAKLASPTMWRECYFEKPRIFIKEVAPDMYNKMFKDYSYEQVLYCKGELKAALTRVSSTSLKSIWAEDVSSKKIVIDEFMNFVKDIFDVSTGFEEPNRVIDQIAGWVWLLRVENSKETGRDTSAIPDLVKIIDVSNYFPDAATMYYLSLNLQDRIMYGDDFLNIMKSYKIEVNQQLKSTIDLIEDMKQKEIEGYAI